MKLETIMENILRKNNIPVNHIHGPQKAAITRLIRAGKAIKTNKEYRLSTRSILKLK